VENIRSIKLLPAFPSLPRFPVSSERKTRQLENGQDFTRPLIHVPKQMLTKGSKAENEVTAFFLGLFFF
jgi:hypothetical protein